MERGRESCLPLPYGVLVNKRLTKDRLTRDNSFKAVPTPGSAIKTGDSAVTRWEQCRCPSSVTERKRGLGFWGAVETNEERVREETSGHKGCLVVQLSVSWRENASWRGSLPGTQTITNENVLYRCQFSLEKSFLLYFRELKSFFSVGWFSVAFSSK